VASLQQIHEELQYNLVAQEVRQRYLNLHRHSLKPKRFDLPEIDEDRRARAKIVKYRAAQSTTPKLPKFLQSNGTRETNESRHPYLRRPSLKLGAY
jgi:hypothetical protein